MRTHFIYILIALVFSILYELYLIGFYKYQDFQINNYVTTLEQTNIQMQERNSQKDKLNTYIRTHAYQTLVAKATQNKHLPGEEVINIVTSSDVAANTPIDVRQMVSQQSTRIPSPFQDLSNREKWQYIFTHLREIDTIVE